MQSKLSRATQRAVAKYGAEWCRVAYSRHILIGEGASTVAQLIPCMAIRTTQQADAAINAGRELATVGA